MTPIAPARIRLGAALMRSTCVIAAAVVLAAAQACSPQPAPPAQDAPAPEDTISLRNSQTLREFSATAKPLLTEAALREAFELPPPDAWKPGGTSERPRGGIELYTSVAPSVVIVRTTSGHGSGFIVSADGLIVTNDHVVESGLQHRAEGSYAMVHQGRMSPEGIMQLQGDPTEAQLLKVDTVNDLALLKLVRPTGAPPLPYIKLSAAAPRPGLDCAIIGHPSSGMLWTFRPCQVSSIGDFPKDMVNLVLSRLASTGAQRSEIEAFVKNQPPRRIMLTSAQANPGDSGGPVLDKDGALIGVTFAGPGNTAEDKFTYHVHVDEVRRFLAQPPASPMLLVPDPWKFGRRVMVRDLDGDGRADVLIAGTDDPEVMLFDLDNDTPAAMLGSDAALARVVREKRWDFEVAVDIRGMGYTSFYDTDNDGRVDFILTSDTESQLAKGIFTLGAGGQWRYQPAPAGQRILSAANLKNAELGRKLEAFFRAMK